MSASMNGADRETAQALLDAAMAAGAEAADVLVVSETSLGVGVSNRALEEAERSESIDIGLRVLMGRRQACVSASDRRPGTLREMAARAVASAAEAPEDPWCGLAERHQIMTGPPVALDLLDPADPPEPEALEEMARAAEDAALTIAGVTMVEQASASWGADRVTLLASNGIDHSMERSFSAVSVSVIAGSGLGRERDHASEIRRHRADLPSPQSVGQRAAERAVAALSPRKPPPGRWPVLYDERVAGSLIGHLLGAINGQMVARGSSWLRGRMGEAVLPGGLDLIEDPLIPRGRASRPMDAEGIAASRRALVEDGVLRSWVLDLATGRQLGLPTTGNARRGTGGPQGPGTTNVILTPGSISRAELIRQMGTGLLVTGLIGSSVNPNTGDYSRGANGFWVEGGEIAWPVNEITLAGSLPQMLASLLPANDADPWKALSIPSLLVEGLTLGA